MRSEPKKAGSVLVKIPNGSTITYVEDAGTADGHNWVKITYNGKEGYAAAEYVIKGTAPTAAPTTAPTQAETKAPETAAPTQAGPGGPSGDNGGNIAVGPGA